MIQTFVVREILGVVKKSGTQSESGVEFRKETVREGFYAGKRAKSSRAG